MSSLQLVSVEENAPNISTRMSISLKDEQNAGKEQTWPKQPLHLQHLISVRQGRIALNFL